MPRARNPTRVPVIFDPRLSTRRARQLVHPPPPYLSLSSPRAACAPAPLARRQPPITRCLLGFSILSLSRGERRSTRRGVCSQSSSLGQRGQIDGRHMLCTSAVVSGARTPTIERKKKQQRQQIESKISGVVLVVRQRARKHACVLLLSLCLLAVRCARARAQKRENSWRVGGPRNSPLLLTNIFNQENIQRGEEFGVDERRRCFIPSITDAPRPRG